jgi:hypothetical protein
VAKGTRAGVVQSVSTYHRRNRKGQFALASREGLNSKPRDMLSLSGYFPNMNFIGNFLLQYKNSEPGSQGAAMLIEYFEWLGRNRWICNEQHSKAANRKFKAIFHSTVQYFFGQMPGWFRAKRDTYFGPQFVKELEEYQTAVKVIELSIVIPCHNTKENLMEMLDKILQWGQRQAPDSYEIIVIDDSSTDGTLEALQTLQEKNEQIFVMEGGGKGAGRARNSAIPLIEGRYVFFLDADDDLRMDNLWKAVSSAKVLDTDLMFLPYNLSMPIFRGLDETDGSGKTMVIFTCMSGQGSEEFLNYEIQSNSKDECARECAYLRDKCAAFDFSESEKICRMFEKSQYFDQNTGISQKGSILPSDSFDEDREYCSSGNDLSSVNSVNGEQPTKLSSFLMPMMSADEREWNGVFELQQSAITRVEDVKRGAYRLINYPWNRIIKTQVLRSKGIFFGPTPVHNDVQVVCKIVLRLANVKCFLYLSSTGILLPPLRL